MCSKIITLLQAVPIPIILHTLYVTICISPAILFFNQNDELLVIIVHYLQPTVLKCIFVKTI